MGNENTVFTSSKLFVDARDGRLDSVRKGLKAAADFDLNAQDPETGRTALIAASNSDMAEIVKLLLKKKIDLDLQDVYGLTALHVAAYGGYTDIVEQLLKKKAALNLQDADGATPLHCASCAGHVEALRLLLQAGADTSVRNKCKLVAEQVARNAETRRVFSSEHEKEACGVSADADVGVEQYVCAKTIIDANNECERQGPESRKECSPG